MNRPEKVFDSYLHPFRSMVLFSKISENLALTKISNYKNLSRELMVGGNQ